MVWGISLVVEQTSPKRLVGVRFLYPPQLTKYLYVILYKQKEKKI